MWAATSVAGLPPSVPKSYTKPPVPTRNDVPVMGLCSSKNFVAENVVEASAAPPRYQEHLEVGGWLGFRIRIYGR